MFSAISNELWSSEVCSKCEGTFGIMQLSPKRRYLCRFCGGAFCGTCCPHVSEFGGVALNCCEDCHSKRSQGAFPHIAQWVAETQGIDKPSSDDILRAVEGIASDETTKNRIGVRAKGQTGPPSAVGPQSPTPLEEQAVENLPADDEIVQWGATLLEDCPSLAEMRYKLVPSRISEELFWRRFFVELATKIFDNVLAQVNTNQR